MLHALILVCALGSVADCTEQTAVDVLRTPVRSALPFLCLRDGEAYLAQTEIGRTLRPGDTVRVVCPREQK